MVTSYTTEGNCLITGSTIISETFICKLKEYARVEGVSAKLGVASELVVELSCGNGVPETAEYCEKDPRTSARPHVDLVPGRNGIGMRLTRADT
jgi:hypothetical protein